MRVKRVNSLNLNRYRYVLLLTLCMLVFTTIYSIYRIGDALNLKQKVQYTREINHRVVDENRFPIVVINWKAGYDDRTLYSNEDCLFTYNKEFINVAKAIMFDFLSLDEETIPWTHYRDKSQVYIWQSWEAPPSILHVNGRDLAKFQNGFINWTMTYRRDSDVSVTYLNMEGMKNILDQGQSWVDQIMKQKKNMALWIVSNCKMTKGAKQRMQFVSELISEGLPVQRYGFCFKEHGSFNDLSEDYRNSFKFYLAFENSKHCTDYITEKFWTNGLLSGRIPVVWGPSKHDVEKVAPKGSYIHTEDFKNAKDLTEYLLHLNSNDTAYRDYFKWVLDPHTFDFLNVKHGANYTNLQALCSKLKLNLKNHKIIPSISEYFFKNESRECIDP